MCLHIALPLSGTPQVAGIAGADAPLDVRVIDTRCATLRSALWSMLPASCAIPAQASTICAKSLSLSVTRFARCSFPDSLDNLVRGGRFPEEAAKQASVLNMRMMLTFNEEDGKVGVIGKSKGAKGDHQRHRRVHRKLCRRTRPHPPSLGALPQPKSGRNFDRHAN